MASLIPTWEMPETIAQKIAQRPPPAYPRSFAFDFIAGEFVIDGGGRVEQAAGYAAWAVWCVKAVLTQRSAYLAYTANYGCEQERIAQAPTRAIAEAEARRVIAEAILADPRSAAVEDFAFSWEGDGLTVGFTATPAVGTAQHVEVQLSYG